MCTISTVLVASTLLLAAPAFAGTGHEHGPGGSHTYGPLTATLAIKQAEKQLKTLVERGKLDKSWSGIKATEATKKDFGKGPEWVVSFKNEKAEAGKQTLYVFYTLSGSYLASNFTGK
ncbi:MAG: DUF6488 family protein [Rhodocyclaceae bacterium]|nr:DUF6488 family protein [Rhodocyclaceae bacterium]MDZ4214870.1 DUF6488 family protein [Rhodocyclaceae bacterium]